MNIPRNFFTKEHTNSRSWNFLSKSPKNIILINTSTAASEEYNSRFQIFTLLIPPLLSPKIRLID
jgi:hypothetical protein